MKAVKEGMSVTLTVKKALASRLVMDGGMDFLSWLVPVDEEMKHESTPPL
jgi:hypothetical protein